MVNKVKLSKIYYVLLIIFIINDVFSESQLVNFSGISVVLTVVRYLDLGILVVAFFYRNLNVKKNIIMLFGIISIFIFFNLSIILIQFQSYVSLSLRASESLSLKVLYTFQLLFLMLFHRKLLSGSSTDQILSFLYYRI